ncbi:hypothetical protein [Enterococcus sp. AZ109]|uniref:hypothetical protein n=1 Tax=Enterococcus sp. AZ109 TaxID=2774634 RepID=UPI003F27B177
MSKIANLITFLLMGAVHGFMLGLYVPFFIDIDFSTGEGTFNESLWLLIIIFSVCGGLFWGITKSNSLGDSWGRNRTALQKIWLGLVTPVLSFLFTIIAAMVVSIAIFLFSLFGFDHLDWLQTLVIIGSMIAACRFNTKNAIEEGMKIKTSYSHYGGGGGYSSYNYTPPTKNYTNDLSKRAHGNSSSFRHGTDLFGNDSSWGNDGTKYTHGEDLFGNKTTYGSDGSRIRHGQDLFGNDVSWSNDGTKYTHSKDLFGNKVTYGSDGSKYLHDKDIFGNDRTTKQ